MAAVTDVFRPSGLTEAVFIWPFMDYPICMTKLLDQAFEMARALPAEAQDDIARVLLQLAGNESEPVELTSGEQAAIAESREQAARGEFATDEQVRAVWAKHGL